MTQPRYIPCSTFTVVCTPHFLEALTARNDLLPPKGHPGLESMFERLWKVGIENTCTGFSWGAGFIYYKCKFNDKRRRWELEFISFTPDNNFHTRNRNFAVKVSP